MALFYWRTLTNTVPYLVLLQHSRDCFHEFQYPLCGKQKGNRNMSNNRLRRSHPLGGLEVSGHVKRNPKTSRKGVSSKGLENNQTELHSAIPHLLLHC